MTAVTTALITPTVQTAPSRPMRAIWFAGTLGLTVGVAAYLIVAGNAGRQVTDGGALRILVFAGGVHVASTGWFYTVPEVRRHAVTHTWRYIVIPVLLIAGTAVGYTMLPEGSEAWVLAPLIAWQLWHFQKQNVGMAALANVSYGSRMSPLERRAIIVAGVAGIVELFARPELFGYLLPWSLETLERPALVVFATAVTVGVVSLLWRRAPVQAFAMTGMALVFYLPPFLFGPVVAATSFSVAHAYQYLVIVGLVAVGGRHRLSSLAALLAVALVGGWAINHVALDGQWGRTVFGAYLGVVMAHFVIDAGLWRLRDQFPRTFLTARLPYLLGRSK